MTMINKLKILMLPGAYNSPSARYRIIQYYAILKQEGYKVSIRYPIPDRIYRTSNLENDFWLKVNPRISQFMRLLSTVWILRDFWIFDVIISNRDIVPDIRIRFIERVINKSRSKFLIDVDDAIHLGHRMDKMIEIFKNAAHIVVGNKYLYDYIINFNSNITIIPTVVNTELISVNHNTEGKFVIGWIGSSGPTKLHLPIIFPALIELSGLTGGKIKILIVSDIEPNLPLELRDIYEFQYWQPDSEGLVLNRMSIGVMPLPDNEFERGKCGFKAIQYMAAGIPALVSPVGANKDIVDDGLNGFHCATTKDWVEKIGILIHNPLLCKEMGHNGRQKVERTYSLTYGVKKWKEVIEKLPFESERWLT